MQRINHIKCYFTGAEIYRHLHHIVNFTMLCAKVGLVSVTWLEIFVVKKLHDTDFFYNLEEKKPIFKLSLQKGIV